MKNLDLKARGIEVMSKKEMNKINGSSFWGPLGIICVAYEAVTGRSLIGDARNTMMEAVEDACMSDDQEYKLRILGH